MKDYSKFLGISKNEFIKYHKVKGDKIIVKFAKRKKIIPYSKEEIEYINDTKNIVKDSETYGKSVLYKLRKGFERRTKSTDLLLRNLPEKTQPLIICGDFNDTPLSYTYNKMSEAGLYDAFITSSKGIGKTYCGSLPLLRIDYFWYNDEIEIVTTTNGIVLRKPEYEVRKIECED